MKSHFFLLFASLMCIQCVRDSGTSGAPLPPPNILWINCEDISPNLGAYGDERATTPNLDQLAKEGITYTNAFATAPICSPARSCLITGLYATALGTQHLRCEVELPEFIQTMPEYLKERGYFVTNYAKTDYNFDPEGIYDYWERDRAPWRHRTSDDQPFFSYFVLGMTHEGPTNNSERWAAQVADMPGELLHDPATQQVPVYHPDTEPFRTCWAHYYDNITLMDTEVGAILDSLEADGLKESTIVIFFSDHGAGMPRYKRWLYRTGLQVPVIAYVPPRYRDWLPVEPGSKDDRLISFVDFAPTALHLAGVAIPETMQGQAFLGDSLPAPPRYVFGARSRADNMYEISRAVTDGRFIYVRHYLPHLSYIQPGIIFSDIKESYAELHRLREAGTLPEQSQRMFKAKPVEELYDLEKDPRELNNLASDPAYLDTRDSLREVLHGWMLDHHDTGLLPEAEYMYRSEGSTPYEMTREPGAFDKRRILEAAELVGRADLGRLTLNLKDQDSGVRYWAVIGLQAKGDTAVSAIPYLEPLLEDPSPAVQIAAAETLCRLGRCEEALPVLGRWALDDRGWIALYAARSIELLGAKVKPILPTLREVLAKHAAEPGSDTRYKDYNFSAFISWSIEYALANCGEERTVEGLF